VGPEFVQTVLLVFVGDEPPVRRAAVADLTVDQAGVSQHF